MHINTLQNILQIFISNTWLYISVSEIDKLWLIFNSNNEPISHAVKKLEHFNKPASYLINSTNGKYLNFVTYNIQENYYLFVFNKTRKHLTIRTQQRLP